jgi:hypothetical protein
LPHQSQQRGFHTGKAHFEIPDLVRANERHDRQHDANT